VTNSSEGIDNFCKKDIFARGLPILSNPWPEGIDYPSEPLSEGIGNLCRHLQADCPINKERGNLYVLSLKKLKAKIKIQGATNSFKHYKKFIFSLGSVDLCYL
jgi:hypothetical protein